jgi:hypothetical protein
MKLARNSCLVCVLSLMMSLSGCSLPQNTLAQDLAWERWRRCDTIPTVMLKEIRADGQIRVTYTDPGRLAEWKACDRKARQELAVRGISGAQVAAGTGQRPATETRPSGTTGALPSSIAAPLWRVGDEWAYRYHGAAGSGTYVWSVDREQSVDGIDCYVIKAGTREIFYRTADLASVQETVDGVSISKFSPPRLNYLWPLHVGKRWEHEAREDRARDRQTRDRAWTWTVDGEENVSVPAGSFQALKITMRNKRTGALIYELWWAPDARQWVKIREHLESGIRERELIALKLGRPSR